MKLISTHYEIEKENHPSYPNTRFFSVFKVTRHRTFWRDLFQMDDLVMREKVNGCTMATSLDDAKRRLKKYLNPDIPKESTFERVAVLDENGDDKLASFE